MQCQKYFDQIPLYLLNELDSSSKEELEIHLKSCPHCQQELKEMRTVISTFEDENSNQMTDAERLRLQNDIFKSLILKRPAKSNQITVVRTIARAAAVVVIFLTGYLVSSFLSNSVKYFPNKFSTTNEQLNQIRSQKFSLSGYRLSKEGLKLIAKGKQTVLDNE